MKPTKIVTIIGARPQFIKAAAVSRVIADCPEGTPIGAIEEIVVHTGQHYDDNMSRVFFDELNIPTPNYHLGVGSGTHGHMTGQMLAKIEDVLMSERPDWVLVYGDTNSTLAGALAAAKLQVPIAHVEAGLRSFNRRMPEEINRVLTDHASRVLFAPTQTAIDNLAREGIINGVVQSGDVMFDAFLHYKSRAQKESKILELLNAGSRRYILATVHRQENTDDPARLSEIFEAFREIGENHLPVIVPLHPRTRKTLHKNGFQMAADDHIKIIEPVGYLDMIQLEANAALIFTDSGGVQKESYFAGVACVTLRDETEWVETVEKGVNILAGATKKTILRSFEQALNVNVGSVPGLYGSGKAAQKIVDSLLKITSATTK